MRFREISDDSEGGGYPHICRNINDIGIVVDLPQHLERQKFARGQLVVGACGSSLPPKEDEDVVALLENPSPPVLVSSGLVGLPAALQRSLDLPKEVKMILRHCRRCRAPCR